MLVVAPGLPLAFNTPPGWPVPHIDWVGGHQGWEPPPRWVPVAGAPAAPAGWRFWEKNLPVWDEAFGPAVKSAKRSIWIGWGIFAAGALITAIGFSSTTGGGGYIVFWGAIIFGPIQAIRAMIRLRNIETAAMAHIRASAPAVKAEIDQLAYQEYLRLHGRAE